MGKYKKYERVSTRRLGQMHPIWRGIGCILIILVPLWSCALATILVPVIGASGRLPYQLFTHVHFPDWVFRWSPLKEVGGFLSRIDNFWALLLLFLLIMPLLTGLFTVLYVFVYQRLVPRYTPFDMPPLKYKAKKYKR